MESSYENIEKDVEGIMSTLLDKKDESQIHFCLLPTHLLYGE